MNGSILETHMERSEKKSCMIIIANQTEENEEYVMKFMQKIKFPLNSLYKKGSLNIYEDDHEKSNPNLIAKISLKNLTAEYAAIINTFVSPTLSVMVCLVDFSFTMEYKKAVLNFKNLLKINKEIFWLTNSPDFFWNHNILKDTKVYFANSKLAQNFFSKLLPLFQIEKEKNKYLSRKRKEHKTFLIEKVPKNPIPLSTKRDSCSLPKENYKRERLRQSGISDIIEKSAEESELNTYGEYGSKNSLINISKEVYKYIKNCKQTKGTDVTNHILNILSSKGNKLNYKNIQRRVYDAINVMNAIGIISKDKGLINYLQGDESSVDMEEDEQDPLIKLQDKEIESLKATRRNNKNVLAQQCCQNYFYSKFIEMNKSEVKRCRTMDKIFFPFYTISLKSGSQYDIKQVDFNNKVVILANEPFQILDPENLIKFYVKNYFDKESMKEHFGEELGNYLKKNNLIEEYLNEGGEFTKGVKKNVVGGNYIHQNVSKNNNFEAEPTQRKESEDFYYYLTNNYTSNFKQDENYELCDGGEKFEFNQLSPYIQNKN